MIPRPVIPTLGSCGDPGGVVFKHFGLFLELLQLPIFGRVSQPLLTYHNSRDFTVITG